MINCGEHKCRQKSDLKIVGKLALSSLRAQRKVAECIQEAIDRAEFKEVGPEAQWIPNEELIVQISVEIARGMAHLHGLDILHSDLNGDPSALLPAPHFSILIVEVRRPTFVACYVVVSFLKSQLTA